MGMSGTAGDAPPQPAVVLDTNVIVAAGFQPRSAAGWLLDAIREGALRLVWDDATRREAERIVGRIPPLARTRIDELYKPEDRYEGTADPAAFAFVEDADDRKFLALAAATGAVLVTLDEHLLGVRAQTSVRVVTPREYRDLLSAPRGSDTPPPG
jgi:predicted nucleic acid-binding protein